MLNDISLRKNSNGNTVVSIDKSLYIFSLPNEYHIRQLFHTKKSVFYDQIAVSEVAVSFQNEFFHGISTIARDRNDLEPESRIYLSCNNTTKESSAVHTYLHVRPMLIPVLEDGVTFDNSLQVNPDGSILHGCSLYCAENCNYSQHQYYPVIKKDLREKPLPEFAKGLTIGDTGDNVGDQLEWVCVNGCLVARRCLFTALPEELYTLGLWFPQPHEIHVQLTSA